MSDANESGIWDRRRFLRRSGAVAAFAAGCSHAPPSRDAQDGEAEVTPGEDLMQEHGVLERILLAYDEAARRIEGGAALDVSAVARAAEIVRRFVEGYHERLEERFVFPRLESARRETELVAVLRRQHERGREVTDDITRLAAAGSSSDLARALRGFVRMYRPHAAREDTVLFPAFRDVVGRAEYRELGEKFEDEEHALFGERGFEIAVADVAHIEEALGIADLASFTP
ncbi:MAG TPA: hemerythrin domain-containing protein [Planctomycetota bacterium]|nr:hemerythrin domain-containing protein [Planctomycetota bacterium]